MDSNIIPISARVGSPTPCKATYPTIGQCNDALKPAGERTGTGELLACLTLVAPSGLTATDRDEWVKVAKATLSGIPADLLKYGCQAARETCRFPSEIVPKIMTEVGNAWGRRKELLYQAEMRHANRNAPRIEKQRLPEPECITAEEFRELMKGILPDSAA